MEDLRPRWHKESGVSANLPELRVSEAVLDDTVDEAKSYGMVFHFGVVEIIQKEGRTFLDYDGIVSAIERRSGLERDLSFELRRREEVASHKHELEEDLLQLVGVGIDYLVFLESFQGA